KTRQETRIYDLIQNCEGRESPPCITAEGVDATARIRREASLLERTGWFSESKQQGKPPRLRRLRRLRDILLMTQPPLLAAMQGGDSRSSQFCCNPDDLFRWAKPKGRDCAWP